MFDAMPSTDTLSHKLFPRPPSPFDGPALAGVSMHSNNPAVVGQGVFATASFATFKMRKDVELWEICFTMLQKVPKAYNKVGQKLHEPRCEKTGLRGFRPGTTKTGLYSHRR